MRVTRSSDGRTPDHDDAAAPSPVTTSTVTGPSPRQCSHWRTPAARITASTVRGADGPGVDVGVGDDVAVGLTAGDDAVAAEADDAAARVTVGTAFGPVTVDDVEPPDEQPVSRSPSASSGSASRTTGIAGFAAAPALSQLLVPITASL